VKEYFAHGLLPLYLFLHTEGRKTKQDVRKVFIPAVITEGLRNVRSIIEVFINQYIFSPLATQYRMDQKKRTNCKHNYVHGTNPGRIMKKTLLRIR
jgi:hypothetical protein